MTSTSFAAASTLEPIVPGAWRAQVTPEWGQGRTAFGGLVAAFALQACAALVGPERPLRSFTMDFVTPAEVGELRVEARLLHQGKATSHVEARVMQGTRVCALLMAIHAVPRQTAIHVDSPAPPPAEGPEGRVELPFIEGLTPAFTRNFAYRWGDHPIPSSGAAETGAGGWVRPREGAADPLTQVAMLDAWPAPVLALTRQPTPASTVLWLVQVHAPLTTWPGETWWRFESEVEGASAGCADTTQRLWAPDGRLALVGRQLVAEFSR